MAKNPIQLTIKNPESKQKPTFSCHWLYVPIVYLLISVEQFGYGIGTAAYSVYLMYLAKNEYKTSHFAISTGLMALGMILPGFISGYLQQ